MAPMGPYESFDQCISDQMNKHKGEKGFTTENARKICGFIKARTEQANASNTPEMDVCIKEGMDKGLSMEEAKKQCMIKMKPMMPPDMMPMAQITDMEATRERMGLTPAQFYAVPREPPSSSKLPIMDAPHVRAAMARFNQVQGISVEERATARRKILAAAKKFNIETKNFE